MEYILSVNQLKNIKVHLNFISTYFGTNFGSNLAFNTLFNLTFNALVESAENSSTYCFSYRSLLLPHQY